MLKCMIQADRQCSYFRSTSFLPALGVSPWSCLQKHAFKPLSVSSRFECHRFTAKSSLLSCILLIQMACNILMLTVCVLSPFCFDSKLLSFFSDSLLLKRGDKDTYVYIKVLKQLLQEGNKKRIRGGNVVTESGFS